VIDSATCRSEFLSRMPHHNRGISMPTARGGGDQSGAGSFKSRTFQKHPVSAANGRGLPVLAKDRREQSGIVEEFAPWPRRPANISGLASSGNEKRC